MEKYANNRFAQGKVADNSKVELHISIDSIDKAIKSLINENL